MNIPNYLTVFRILLTPVFVLFFYLPVEWNHIACATIFMVACLTDWLDGYLARTLNQVSPLGRFLDPVADKLVVAVALVLLVSEPELPYLAIPAAIIVGREIFVSGLREWMAEVGKRASIAVSYVGKCKTMMQMFALFLLLAYEPDGYAFFVYVGYTLIYLASALTLWSMFIYLKLAWPELMR